MLTTIAGLLDDSIPLPDMGKTTPDTATIVKIERVLEAAQDSNE